MSAQEIKADLLLADRPCSFFNLLKHHGPMLSGRHGLKPSDVAVAGEGGVGGVPYGTALKSKNSSRFGCAASRFVRCAEELMKRLSTNLITAV